MESRREPPSRPGSKAIRVTTAKPLIVQRRSAPEAPVGAKSFLASFEAGKEAAVDAYVNAVLDYYGVPGASLALVRDGRVAYHQVYGLRDTAKGLPVEMATLVEAASITKAIFALRRDALGRARRT